MEKKMVKTHLIKDGEYRKWLDELKRKVMKTQIQAAVSVNRELLLFYWELGAEIVSKQKITQWGDGLISQLSADLTNEFPGMKGFSLSNLRYIRQWYIFYSNMVVANPAIHQQPVGELDREILSQITSIPWGHNIAILSGCKVIKEALYYVQQTINYGWSRTVLIHQIEGRLYEREGKALTNFTATLPKPQSDLAQQTLKDPYIFDFLSMEKDYSERDIETALVEHITRFLLELGAGFAYIGRQYPLHVGERDFFIDLLFYHTQLHCYIVIELKTVEFEPEHTGKLNFYIKAIDDQLRKEGDSPTIGILLCKSKDKIVAEYSLSDINKPMGVSEYQLTQALPANLKGRLPTIEEIESELQINNGNI